MVEIIVKIIYVVPDLVFGGVTSVVTRNIVQLKKLNCEILLVSLKEIDKKSFEGCPVQSLNIKSGLDFFKSLVDFNEIVKNFHPDIIHSHTYYAHMLVRFFSLIYKCRSKIIFNEHGTLNEINFYWKIFKILNKSGDFYVNVSQKSLDSYLEKKIFIKESSNVLYNGIDTQEFSKINSNIEKEMYGVFKDDFIFGYVGRLSPEKDLNNLINATAILRSKSRKNFKLLIAGDGPDKSLLAKAVTDNKLDDIVVFVGQKSNLIPFYSIIDALVLSSKTEGLPTVLLEAMSMSCPVISTNCGGVKEIFDGIESFIVSKEDSVALSLAMQKLLEMDPIAISKIGEMNRNQVHSKFSIEQTSLKILSLYEQILK